MGKRGFRGVSSGAAGYPTRESWRRKGLAAGAGALLALSAAAACEFGTTTGGVAELPDEDAGLDAGLPDGGVDPDAGEQTTAGVALAPDGGE